MNPRSSSSEAASVALLLRMNDHNSVVAMVNETMTKTPKTVFTSNTASLLLSNMFAFRRNLHGLLSQSAFSSCRSYTAPAFISAQNAVDLCKSKPDKDLIFVDVRQPEKFEAGCINGAVNMHDIFTYLLPTSSEADLNAMRQHFTNLLVQNGIKCTDKEHVVIYEDGLAKLYGSSCRGYVVFKYMGHPYVSVLEGGYDGIANLEEADRSVVGTKRNPVNQSEDAPAFKYDNGWLCGYQQVLDAVNGKRNAHLLDVRDKEEWIGKSSSPYGVDFCPRKGRIPGAKWIEWYHFMDNDEKVHQQDKVDELMKGQGIGKDDDIIVYCFKGARASNTLMILKECGYHNVSNYFASWNEWSRNMDLPTDDSVLNLENFN